MIPYFVIKSRRRETHVFNRRLMILMSIIALLTTLLLWRLFYLQNIEHRYYTTLSEQNEIDLIPLAPRRGLIYDRYGILLANNTPVFSLMVTPSKVTNLHQML